ncbi:helix-turn-helix domain-containing protein [Streptomyces sp. NPDC051940]|uniref:PucR family transcriptional regulator n=1 Tax=Streptomyces sp. NPDC051940 TaxID=3155675 RepID=UPI00341421B8
MDDTVLGVGATAQTEADALLRGAALLLRRDLDGLAAQITGRLVPDQPDPAGGPQPTGALRELVGAVLSVGLDELADPATAQVDGPVREIGRRRALQGVPLDALLHAFATGWTVLWQQLVDQVAAYRPDRIHLMAQASHRMWGIRDRNAGLLTEAYRDTLGDQAVEPVARARTLLVSLLGGTADSLEIGGAAAVLGVPRTGRFAVVVTHGRSVPHSFDAAGLLRDGLGSRLLRAPRADGETLVVLLGRVPLGLVTAALAEVPRLRAGVGPVVGGLAELHRAARLAEAALATCTGASGVALWDDRMTAGLVAASPELGGALLAATLGPVLALGEPERDVLLDTLAAWLDCDGSSQSAGVRLDCHRNTVLNRLRRLEQLTRRRLSRPLDVVELALALDAHRFAGTESRPGTP